MRIKSTDAVSRSDDAGNEFLEADAPVLDYHAPGRIDAFPEWSTYNAEGVDQDGNEASWLEHGLWPTRPVLIVCPEEVFLCHGDVDDSQGISRRIYSVIPSLGGPLTGLRRYNKGRLYEGGYFLLRENGLWNQDLSEDTLTRYDAPGYGPSVLPPPIVHAGTLLPGFPGMKLDILECHPYEGGDLVVVGGEDAVEVIFREAGQSTWTRPWSAAPLVLGDISGDFSHKIYDMKFRKDGTLFGLGYKAGELALVRTRGPVDVENISTKTSSWILDYVALPGIFADSVADSEVTGDPDTRVRPKLAFDAEGAVFVMTAIGILKVPKPISEPELWYLWVAQEGVDLGLEVHGLRVPAEGHIIDLAFDGANPGILRRLNPDTDAFDDTFLHLANQAFRQIVWTRRYDEVAGGLKVNNTLYPRSSVIYLGRTPSPPEGEGPDGSILGGDT